METITQKIDILQSINFQHSINTLYVGIDPHKYIHHILITNRAMDKLGEFKVHNNQTDINELIKEINKIKEEHNFNNVVIGIEGYHGNGDFITRNLLKEFNSIYEVPVALTSNYRKSSIYREKTDSIDAKGVINALVTNLPKLSVITSKSNDRIAIMLRDLTMNRNRFVSSRIGFKNAIHNLMQHIDPEYVKTVKNFNSKKTRKTTKEFCDNILISDTDLEIKNRAKLVITNIERVNDFEEQINAIEKEIKNILINSRYQKIIDSFKGVNYITMAELISWIYDINRFPTPEKFCKYCGIAPVACSSGKSNKLINSKAGVKSLRTTFRTIAIVRVRRSPEDEQYFKKQLSKGKTKKQSLKLVMRKNALVLYALLSKDQPYISPVLA